MKTKILVLIFGGFWLTVEVMIEDMRGIDTHIYITLSIVVVVFTLCDDCEKNILVRVILYWEDIKQ